MTTPCINTIIAAGSVDGILTSAALLRLIENENVRVIFTQPNTIDKISVEELGAGSKLALVDLAVNNANPKMTVDFIGRIRQAGHEVVAIIDEHDRQAWFGILGNFDGLLVEPQSQSEGKFCSSGAILMAAYPEMDEYAK